MSDDTDLSTIEIAAELTIAWLGNANTRVSADDVPAFLKRMYDTVSGLDGGNAVPAPAEQAQNFTPAVSVRKSLASPDHIISMIDGRPYRALRRHLTTNGLTPDEYRRRYGLKADYPMTASSYSEARRAMAKTIGLGRKRSAQPVGDDAPTKSAPAVDAPKTKPAPRRRMKKADS